jgi:uncharacterized membrane protein YcaP (DUF421 family)
VPLWVEAIILFSVATLLLRIGGKETISSMNMGEVVVMIGIASIMVEPLKSKQLLTSIYSGSLLIGFSLFLVFVQIYFPRTKRWIMGEPILLVENGQIIHKNLKRARVTVDDVKMRLRVEQVDDLTKVKYATLEPSGKMGIELYSEYTFATKKDIEELKTAIQMIGGKLDVFPVFYTPPSDPEQNLFQQAEEIQNHDPLQ